MNKDFYKHLIKNSSYGETETTTGMIFVYTKIGIFKILPPGYESPCWVMSGGTLLTYVVSGKLSVFYGICKEGESHYHRYESRPNAKDPNLVLYSDQRECSVRFDRVEDFEEGCFVEIDGFTIRKSIAKKETILYGVNVTKGASSLCSIFYNEENPPQTKWEALDENSLRHSIDRILSVL